MHCTGTGVREEDKNLSLMKGGYPLKHCFSLVFFPPSLA